MKAISLSNAKSSSTDTQTHLLLFKDACLGHDGVAGVCDREGVVPVVVGYRSVALAHHQKEAHDGVACIAAAGEEVHDIM